MMKRIMIWVGIIVSTVAIAILLMLLVYSNNSESLQKNLLESSEVFKKEYIYKMLDGTPTSYLDNYTDALMLLISAYDGEENLINKSFENYYNTLYNRYPNEVLASIGGKNFIRTLYPRYWHGYVIFLRPLLTIFNYAQIRILNVIFQIVILITFVVLMLIKKKEKYLIPFISAYMIINPMTIFFSMQNSTCWYISMISCILYLIFSDKIKEKKLYYIFFTLIGMNTSFFDFLTYPIATLGIPLILNLISEKMNFNEMIKKIISACIFWLLGYCVMWGAKWVVASIVSNENIIKDAMKQIKFRSSNNKFGNKLSRVEVVKNTLSIFKLPITYYVININILFCWIILFLNRKNYRKEKFLKALLNSIPIFSVALLSIVWYFIVANHSAIHYFFSFRTSWSLWLSILVCMYKTVYDSIEKY